MNAENQNAEMLQQRMEIQKQIQELENLARAYLSREALSRYGTLKAAHPEKAVQTLVMVAQGVHTGRIKEVITDEHFKQMLMQIESPRKEFRLTKK